MPFISFTVYFLVPLIKLFHINNWEIISKELLHRCKANVSLDFGDGRNTKQRNWRVSYFRLLFYLPDKLWMVLEFCWDFYVCLAPHYWQSGRREEHVDRCRFMFFSWKRRCRFMFTPFFSCLLFILQNSMASQKSILHLRAAWLFLRKQIFQWDQTSI